MGGICRRPVTALKPPGMDHSGGDISRVAFHFTDHFRDVKTMNVPSVDDLALIKSVEDLINSNIAVEVEETTLL